MRDINFVLYFGQQANTTVTTVHAMMMMINEEFTNQSNCSFYLNLAKASCVSHGRQFHSEIKDVGAGRKPRFQTTGNAIFSESLLVTNVQILRRLFEESSVAMECLRKIRGQTDSIRSMLLCHHTLCSKIKQQIMGLGNVRCAHLVSLAALIGLVPLEFYVNIPMHMSGTGKGGPEKFMIEEMNWKTIRNDFAGDNDNIKLIHWTAGIIAEMNDHFGNEWTPNMFENTSCIISRNSTRVDVHYLLPWWDKNKCELTDSYHQLEFRVMGGKKRDWELLAFNGERKHVFLSNHRQSIFQRNDGTNGRLHVYENM